MKLLAEDILYHPVYLLVTSYYSYMVWTILRDGCQNIRDEHELLLMRYCREFMRDFVWYRLNDIA